MAQKQDKRHYNTGQPRKEAKLKKEPVTIYETFEDILLLGGKEKVRQIMKAAVAIALADLEHSKPGL